MIMKYSYRHFCYPSRKQRKYAKRIHIDMNDFIVIFSNDMIDINHECNWIFIIWCNLINPPSHCIYLFSNINFVIIMNNKVKLHFIPIYMFVVLQDNSFNTTASYNS